ncbi:MAG: hypothetical protein NVSMB55_00690 [Mycobacteriales bacterium]
MGTRNATGKQPKIKRSRRLEAASGSWFRNGADTSDDLLHRDPRCGALGVAMVRRLDDAHAKGLPRCPRCAPAERTAPSHGIPLQAADIPARRLITPGHPVAGGAPGLGKRR